MIKLIDDIKLLERLCEKEPYFGSLFTSAAVSFMDDPELLSIWVELDKEGRAHSFLNASADSLMFFSPFGLPGMEMMLFVTNILSSGNIKSVDCDEYCFRVLNNIYDFDIENAVQMFAEKRIEIPENGFDTSDFGNYDEAYSVMNAAFGEEDAPSADLWKLKMVRGVLKGQTTLYTLNEDDRTVSCACIRGRTENAGAITSVVTLPEYRHRGYASYLTALCSNKLIDEHRTPWLVPANPGVQKMYEKLGFTAAKNYYYLYNIKEKEDNK